MADGGSMMHVNGTSNGADLIGLMTATAALLPIECLMSCGSEVASYFC